MKAKIYWRKTIEQIQEWLWDTIETGFQFLETEEEVESWENTNQ